MYGWAVGEPERTDRLWNTDEWWNLGSIVRRTDGRSTGWIDKQMDGYETADNAFG